MEMMSKTEELYAQVCEKLGKEAEGSAPREVIAKHLKERCRGDVAACMAVLDSAKTLQGAYKAIEDEAYNRYLKDRQQKGVCIASYEGYEIVDKYYGIMPTVYGEPVEKRSPAEPSTGKVVSLFDMF